MNQQTTADMKAPRKLTWHWGCLAFLGIWWVLWGINPTYRDIWLTESILVFAAVPFLIWIHRRIGLSDFGWTLITVFLAFHIVGSNYSYTEVPIGEWARDALGYKRNHYDRLVHFLFGLLVAVPIREVLARGARIQSFAVSCWLTIAIVMAVSTSFEFLEWWFLLVMDVDAGISYLGAQGDVWDAHKDTALASLGAVISMGLVYLAEKRRL